MTSANLCADKPVSAAGKPAHTTASSPDASATGAADAGEELDCIVYGPDSETDGFDALEAEWNALLQRARYNTIFLTHEWLSTWWNYLGEGELWILAMRRPATGELAGIVPLYLTTPQAGERAGLRTLFLVGCIEVSDYLDIIAAKEWETAVYRTLLRWLHSDAAPAWDAVDLCNLPQDSRTYQDLPDLAAEFDVDANVMREDVAPQFELPTRYETYLSDLVDKKQRHEIRRKQRRAEREARVDYILVQPEDNLDAEMDDFIALQQASRSDKAEFMTPEMRRFFHAMARRMMQKGWLRLSFLSIDGEKAAALLAFEYNRRYLLYNSGYDPEAHAHLSPGWVQLAYAIQYAIAVGCQVFDFMQGDEEYKYRFGSHDYDVMRVILRRRA